MLRKITFKYMNLFQLRIFTFLNNVLRNKEEIYEPKYTKNEIFTKNLPKLYIFKNSKFWNFTNSTFLKLRY